MAFIRHTYLSAILAISFHSTVSFPAEKLTIRADLWCPYNCAPNSAAPGVLIEILQETMGKEGFVLDYDTIPWTQAVADVRTGKYDSVVGVAAPDSVGLLHTAKPQMISITCAYGLQSSKASIHSAADLRKLKKIGVSKDYSYGEEGDKVLHDPSMKSKVSPIGSDDPLTVNIRRVMDGKIEAVLEDENVMNYQMQEKKIASLKKLGCTEDRVDLWIGFTGSNPKSKSWVSLIDSGQANLEKSGRIFEIYKKYGIKPL